MTTQPPGRPPTRWRAPALGLAMCLVVAACGGSGQDSTPTTALGPPETVPTDDRALEVGQLSERGQGTSCEPGASQCLAFEVDCGGLRRAGRGELDIRTATGQVRGVVVMFSGSNGGQWYSVQHRAGGLVEDLRADGMTVVQVVWTRGSWLTSGPGEQAGTAAVACRPATVARWAHDQVYAPLGLDPAPLTCGFCLTGNSGGASQAAYALAFYGMDDLVDMVVATSGPPHGDQAGGCLRQEGTDALWYASDSQTANIDEPYGFGSGTGTGGPCQQGDASYLDRWRADSLATGARDYVHPDTRMHFVLGGADDTPAPAQARAYIAQLEAAGSPQVTVEEVEGMPHGLDEQGLARIRAALTGGS